MKVMSDRTFRPLTALSRFKTEDEVMRRANCIEVDLAAYMITPDLSRYYRVDEKLGFGMIAINFSVISDAAAP